MKSRSLAALTLALSLGLTACMVGPDYERPEVPLVEDWHTDLKYKTVTESSLADLTWLEIFQDEKLRSVIQQALLENKFMLVAMERIEEARARHRIARSALFPRIDLDFSAERESESNLTETDAQRIDTFFFGPIFGWELDLWGKNRRANRAAYADYLATEYAARAVQLALIAEVSRAYFQLQGVDARLHVAQSTLDARLQSLNIAEKRFRGGLISKLEVKQAEVEVATTRAEIPDTEQQKLTLENELSVLMGLPPQHLSLEAKLRDQYIPSSVTAGLPASLLQRRPDILQAEQRLISASELVGFAKARLFPSIGLTGSLGYETAEFSDLLDSDGRYWILNLDIIMPLFNAGARRAELTAAQSRFNQSRLAYEQTVLNAMREVSDSLTQFHKAGESLEAWLALEAASTEYLQLATKRYRNGVLPFLDVLDAQRLLFEAQVAVSFAREDQLLALVNLFKALGGGWDPASVPAPPPEDA